MSRAIGKISKTCHIYVSGIGDSYCMIPTVTTRQMQEVDRLMVEEYRITLIQMMENAGRNLAELAIRLGESDLREREIIVLCGAGNNGGGGMAAARHLHNRGARVSVIMVADEQWLKEIPAHQWNILKKMNLVGPDGKSHPIEKPALIIDAMIGYGLQGDPRSHVANWIEWANGTGAPILALDTPSGLDTNSGTPGEPCIRATATLTLALPKTGLVVPQAGPYVGELYLADISVPPELYRRIGIETAPLFWPDTIIRLS